jgi:hypothetical protein
MIKDSDHVVVLIAYEYFKVPSSHLPTDPKKNKKIVSQDSWSPC